MCAMMQKFRVCFIDANITQFFWLPLFDRNIILLYHMAQIEELTKITGCRFYNDRVDLKLETREDIEKILEK